MSEPLNVPLPLLPVMCGSCPFRTDGRQIHLAPSAMSNIMGYLLQGTPHICHHAEVTGSGPERT